MSFRQPESLDEAYEQKALKQGWNFQPVFGQKSHNKQNKNPDIWPLVIKDMYNRDKFGKAKYGVGLKPFNGRDSLKDAYEEVLDLAVYLRQSIYERDNENK